MDRRKPGSKHHLITCGRGNPLAAEASAGNVNDVTRFVALVDAVPPVRGRRGRPRRRPTSVYGDRAYHSRKSRRKRLNELFDLSNQPLMRSPIFQNDTLSRPSPDHMGCGRGVRPGIDQARERQLGVPVIASS